MKSDFVRPYLW